MIHGITEKDVINKPEFIDLWDTLKKYLENQIIIAHNASFDISVLRHVLTEYDIPFPSFDYLCTVKVSQKTWPNQINYRLDTLAEALNINFIHHDACEDALACSKILLQASKEMDTCSLNNLATVLGIKIGKLFPGGYKPCSTKKCKSISAKDFIPNVNNFDEENPFYNKKVVFTGTLGSMTRKKAMQKIVDIGGIVGSGITKDTDFLVMGEQDHNRFSDGISSNKLKKAITLVEKGTGIEIISENDFLRMLT